MLSELDQKIIIKLQGDLPLTPQPYQTIAKELEISEEELLSKISYYQQEGLMRRLCASLYHRKAGYRANAMVVWNVPEAEIEETGKLLASFSQVSHCYRRSVCPGWPYNLFIMVHAKNRNECEEIILKMANAIPAFPYEVLYSIEELKKSSMKYFLEE